MLAYIITQIRLTEWSVSYILFFSHVAKFVNSDKFKQQGAINKTNIHLAILENIY